MSQASVKEALSQTIAGIQNNRIANITFHAQTVWKGLSASWIRSRGEPPLYGKTTRFAPGMIAAALSLGSANALSGPYGYDLHNTLAPASGAMAGASLARPQDLVSSIFGNPATLSQMKGTKFSFGATFYTPEVDLTHDGSVTGTAFEQASGTGTFAVPNVGVTQDLSGLGMPATFGLGLTAVSGIGAQFRANPGSLGAGAEFVVLGVNAGLGYQVTEHLSLGAALTISFAELDLGLSSTSAGTNALGVRGTLGATYEFGPTTVGAFYQSELKHTFNDIIQTSPNSYASIDTEQPANVGIGIANNSLMQGNLLLAADFMYKYWDQADFWSDVFQNQAVFAVGAQLTRNKWKYRVGYGYSEDPTRENVTGGLGSLTQVQSSFGTIPLTPPVVQYLQAAEAETIYKHRLTAGIGYQGFLAPFIDLDLQAGWQFKEERDYGTGSLPGGGHSSAETHSWHVGFGLTWNF